MKSFRRVMFPVAVLYLAFAGFTAGVGLFADGGTVWERALISGLHPIGGLALLFLVRVDRIIHDRRTWGAVALLSASIVGDIAASVAITSGAIEGDAALPLVFAVIPAIGLIYSVLRLTGIGQVRQS